MMPCDQKQTIKSMQAEISNIKEVLSGSDGRSGIISEMIVLNQNNVNLALSVKELTVEVNKLREYRIQRETVRDVKYKRRELRQYIITTIIAVSAIIVTLLIALNIVKQIQV